MDDQEQRARRLLIDRLVRRFGTPEDDVRDMVNRGFDDYRFARIRDYVELLVEREVSDVLRGRTSHVPAQRQPVEARVVRSPAGDDAVA